MTIRILLDLKNEIIKVNIMFMYLTVSGPELQWEQNGLHKCSWKKNLALGCDSQKEEVFFWQFTFLNQNLVG